VTLKIYADTQEVQALPDVGSAQAAPPEHGSGAASEQASPSELDRVLDAWHTATDRLQRTHEVLREEVRRLTNELELKNRELAHRNRLADLGRMAAHIAHEVRNGLAPVTLYLSLLRRRLDGDVQALAIMDKVQAGFTALEVTVHDLLNFTSDREPVWGQFSVAGLVEEACQALAPQMAAQQIELSIDVTPRLRILADRNLLRRAILNLMLNALDAMPDGGQLVVTALETRRGLELEVADSGPGIAPAVRERIFEPFFTTKSDGTGLGLAIVFQIAAAHGGSVEVADCPEGGAALTLVIPRRTLEAAA
jgi:signal transduction histidine kinase